MVMPVLSGHLNIKFMVMLHRMWWIYQYVWSF